MSQESSRRPHRVALVVADGSNPFELNVAVEVFGISRPEVGMPWYELSVCAAEPTVRLREGLYELRCRGTLRDVVDADTVIAPNRPDPEVPLDGRVVRALQQAASRGARMMSFCTGAFSLAEAGLLDGRPATTQWMWTEAFRQRYPRVELRPGLLHVDDGDVLTSAGSAAALDLCLHVVRRDHGAAIARKVSDRLVFPGYREGGQQQFIARPTGGDPPALGAVLDWARRHLADTLSVADLSRRAGMAPSTFHRRFLALTGTTPLRWLLLQRLDLARELLETTDLSTEQIASRVGHGTGSNLRDHFNRHVGLSPSAYRRSHRAKARHF
jgi:AraC family transcriptional regulator, transcriptional activator FtrA